MDNEWRAGEMWGDECWAGMQGVGLWEITAFLCAYLALKIKPGVKWDGLESPRGKAFSGSFLFVNLIGAFLGKLAGGFMKSHIMLHRDGTSIQDPVLASGVPLAVLSLPPALGGREHWAARKRRAAVLMQSFSKELKENHWEMNFPLTSFENPVTSKQISKLPS